MNLDSVFEDLEAQFSAQNEALPEVAIQAKRFVWLEANVLVVRLASAQLRQHCLIAPIMGADFVAGLLPHKNQWLMIPTCSIAKLTFETQPNLPTVRLLEANATDFVNQLQICPDVFWRHAGDLNETAGWLIDARDGLLVLAEPGSNSPFAIPVTQLLSLRFSAVENC